MLKDRIHASGHATPPNPHSHTANLHSYTFTRSQLYYNSVQSSLEVQLSLQHEAISQRSTHVCGIMYSVSWHSLWWSSTIDRPLSTRINETMQV